MTTIILFGDYDRTVSGTSKNMSHLLHSAHALCTKIYMPFSFTCVKHLIDNICHVIWWPINVRARCPVPQNIFAPCIFAHYLCCRCWGTLRPVAESARGRRIQPTSIGLRCLRTAQLLINLISHYMPLLKHILY